MSGVELQKSLRVLEIEEQGFLEDIKNTTDPKETLELANILADIRSQIKELEQIEEQIA